MANHGSYLVGRALVLALPESNTWQPAVDVLVSCFVHRNYVNQPTNHEESLSKGFTSVIYLVEV